MAFKKIDTNTNMSPGSQSDRVILEDKGDTLEGHLVEKATLKAKDGKEFQKYTFKTKNGLKSTLGGHQIDKGLADIPVGTLVRLTCDGYKKLEGGRKVKLVTVEADEDDIVNVMESAEDVLESARV